MHLTTKLVSLLFSQIPIVIASPPESLFLEPVQYLTWVPLHALSLLCSHWSLTQYNSSLALLSTPHHQKRTKVVDSKNVSSSHLEEEPPWSMC